MSTSRFQTALGKANKKLKQADTKTTAVKRRSTQAGKAARAPKITFVLFDEIKAPSPVQSRSKVFDVDQFPKDRELLESIQARGVVTPIVVRDLTPAADEGGLAEIRRVGERTFALIAGHRRVEAAKLAGLQGVPGVLVKGDDDHELMTLAENMGRRELTTYEKASAVRSLKESRELTVRETAEATGLSIGAISRMVSSFDAPDVLKELWKNGSLPLSAMALLKRHWGKFDKTLSKDNLAKIAGISKREANNLSAQLDAGTDLETALQSTGNLVLNRTDAKNTPAIEKKKSAQNTARNSGDNKKFKSEQKEAILEELMRVFPRIKPEQCKTIFDLAIVKNVKEVEVLWAAALFVSRGGKADQAVDYYLKVMQDRSRRSYIKKEVNLMKQVSGNLHALKRGEKKEEKHFLKTVFMGS